MFKVLRDTESDICRSCDSAFPTQGAQVRTCSLFLLQVLHLEFQVSILSTSRPSVHWFTATPDPSKSVFKPFIFTPNVTISKHTYCAEDKVRIIRNNVSLRTKSLIAFNRNLNHTRFTSCTRTLKARLMFRSCYDKWKLIV